MNNDLKAVSVFLMVLCILIFGYEVKASNEPIKKLPAVHPYILVTESGFNEIINRANGEFSAVYTALRDTADALIEAGPTEYYIDSSDEENWMRDEADSVIKLTLVYKISGNPIYKNAASAYINNAMTYPSWGRGEKHTNNDLASASMLTAFSIYYDWMYAELPANEKKAIEDTVFERASAMATVDNSSIPWWKQAYLQNHLWVCCSALMTTAAAFWDVYPQTASAWAAFAKSKMDIAFTYLPKDGSLHEGAIYWKYGMRYMNYYVRIADECFGLTQYKNDSFYKNTSFFFMNLLLPIASDGRYGTVFAFSDSQSFISSDYVSVLYSLADKCSLSNIRELADTHRKNAQSNASSDQQVKRDAAVIQLKQMWESLLYGNSVQGDSIQYPCDVVFNELGYAFSRTSYNDFYSSAFAVRCGYLLGNIAQQSPLKYNPGLSHIHPDINSILLYANGVSMLTDDGYATAYTEGHNTLLINGNGQKGDDQQWDYSLLAQYTPHITAWSVNDDYTYIACDATAAYPTERGLQKYVRHCLFIKPDILIVADEIEMTDSSTAANLELRFFPTYQNGKTLKDGSFLFGDGRKVNLIIKSDCENADIVNINRYTGKNLQSERQAVVIKDYKNKWNTATTFVFGDADSELPIVKAYTIGDTVSVEGTRGGVPIKAEIQLTQSFADVRYGNVYIDDKVYTQDGGKYSAKFMCENLTENDIRVRAMVALYDSTGKLKKCHMSDLTNIVSNTQKQINIIGETLPEWSDKAVVFVWNDKLMPLCLPFGKQSQGEYTDEN